MFQRFNNSGRPGAWRLLVFVIGLLIASDAGLIHQAAAQEGAEPAINKNFVDPDLDVGRWLDIFERESREVYAARHAITDAMGLSAGSRIADIGAGTGFFTLLFARSVGPDGVVYAVDISPRFLELINERATASQIDNIVSVLGRRKSVTLPAESIDVAFTSDTYHHFEDPAAMLESISRSLRPGGAFIVVDFRKDNQTVSEGHIRADKESVIREIEAAGFTFEEAVPVAGLKENYFLRFTNP